MTTERDRTTEYTLGGLPMLESKTPGEVFGEVIDEGPFAVNAGDVFTEEHKQLSDSKKPEELGVEFWLQFPIQVRPLRFVPGRNRAEKRRFRALADQEERGTISKGNKKKLDGLYRMLAAAGVLKQAK